MSPKTVALLDPAALKALTVKPVRLVVTSGPDKDQSFRIDRRTEILGSDPDLELSLTDEAVSRRHAVFEMSEGGLKLRDLHSTNGTWVNDVRVCEAFLPLPCRVRVGETELLVQAEDDPVQVDTYTTDRLGPMVGGSDAMREVFALVARAAQTDATVIVTGESGTGKELVARALHDLSERKSAPFVVFDCGAVPKELIESELFGHVKGAFTGASAPRTGAFREANRGTLFLDEIGELQPELQPRLLRVLESLEVKAVGSERREKVDVRIVAATNRPLKSMVREGSFREDLFYRLAQLEVRLPPLRDRPEDIPLLVETYLKEAATDGNVQVGYDTMRRLMAHHWPGNVRELRNYLDRAILLSGDGRLESRFLVPAVTDTERSAAPDAGTGSEEGGAGADHGLPVHYDLPFKDAKSRLVEAFEKAYWLRMLEAHRWNISAAARAAGIHRKSLEYVVRKLGLRNGGQ